MRISREEMKVALRMVLSFAWGVELTHICRFDCPVSHIKVLPRLRILSSLSFVSI